MDKYNGRMEMTEERVVFTLNTGQQKLSNLKNIRKKPIFFKNE